MNATPRREFLRAAAFAAAAPAFAANRLGANERIRVAVVGVRGRGKSAISAFTKLAGSHNVELVGLCDVDGPVLDERLTEYEKANGQRLTRWTDMRRVLDDPSIHAVSFATPNHWHALGTVWALQAGKHVYCEKPGTHTYEEGKKVVEAARKYGLVVQHGTQNRSSPNIVEAIRRLQEGVIGRVYLARGVAYKSRADVGRITPEPVPAGLDWDAWLGPAAKVPYSKRRQSSPAGGSWHLLWDYGNGEIGNQGVHELDIMRWGLGLDEQPSKVVSMGGNFVHPASEQDSPQVQAMAYEYAGRDLMMTFETRSGLTNTEAGMGDEYPFLDKKNVVGVIFVGTEGYMIIPDYSSYHTFLGPKREKGPSATGAGDIADVPHYENFLEAVRAGDPKRANAGPLDLHYSSALAHFANISQRTGRMVHFDAKKEVFAGDEEATRMLRREKYRAPYTMPEKV